MLKVAYPDTVVGQGFVYRSPQTGGEFKNINLYTLHGIVSQHLKVNNFSLDNGEFEENVCRNTPNIVCTEGVRGAGDLFHALISPFSAALDAIAQTNTAGCGGCLKRQHQMNG